MQCHKWVWGLFLQICLDSWIQPKSLNTLQEQPAQYRSPPDGGAIGSSKANRPVGRSTMRYMQKINATKWPAWWSIYTSIQQTASLGSWSIIYYHAMNDNHILKPRERFTVNTTTALVLMVSDVRANAVVHKKKNLQGFNNTLHSMDPSTET